MIGGLLKGRWRLEFHQGWGAAPDAEDPTLELDEHGHGSLRAGELRADIDYRVAPRERNAGMEFSWVGQRDGQDTFLSGRGWAMVEGGDSLRGELLVHRGDAYRFRAHRLW